MFLLIASWGNADMSNWVNVWLSHTFLYTFCVEVDKKLLKSIFRSSLKNSLIILCNRPWYLIAFEYLSLENPDTNLVCGDYFMSYKIKILLIKKWIHKILLWVTEILITYISNQNSVLLPIKRSNWKRSHF